ncbi:MAG TPA: hypothetical protein VHH34_11835 [Pseudonocardiaceae bacterium]|nr:hypothetical protein [Pseudonocardiaceae bacterium]
MNKSQDDLQTPEQVTHMWNCVKEALAANKNPTTRQIDRMAAVVGEELAATTLDGWFRTWSVVPSWGKFYALIKALGAEQDEDWRALHEAALTADRRRKREERQKKNSAHHAELPAPADPVTPGSAPTVPALSPQTVAAPAGMRAMKVGAAVVVVLAAITILRMMSSFDQGGSEVAAGLAAEPAPSGAPAPAVRYCAPVVREIAVVYSAPEVSSRRIKFKYLNDEITLSNRPSPAGWLSVQTPWDEPGFNWMRTTDLAPPAPC